MKQVTLNFARDKKSAFDKQRKKRRKCYQRLRAHFYQNETLELGALVKVGVRVKVYNRKKKH